MKKMITLGLCFFISLATNLLAASPNGSDKDWVFDPKTSTLIPKYLGQIKAIKGKAIVGDRELKKGSKIYNNDLIQTMDQAFVVLEMVDLTTVTLGPHSEFKVSNWSYRTKNDRDAEFTVLKGQWRALVRSKAKDEDQLKIKTPLVSMGIRGTELMVNVLKDGEKDITQVALLEGSVHIDGDKQQDMVPGDHTVIVKDSSGMNHNDRKMNDTELKSYQEFIEPEISKLLDPVKLSPASAESRNNVETNATLSPTIKENSNESPSLSVKEKLKQLNSLREKNLRK